MSFIRAILSGLLGGLDILFDSVGVLARLFARGSFTPDRLSFRSERFAELPATESLVQRAHINAADEGQARRAIQTEPDRYLPFAIDEALMDIAGPIDAAVPGKAPPEREYIIALLRRETVTEWRASHLRPPFSGPESFIVRPAFPNARPLVFHDPEGTRQRQARRGFVAAGIALLAWSACDFYAAWTTGLDARAAASEQTIDAMKAQIHIAQRDTARLSETLANFHGGAALSARDAMDVLDRVAVRLAPASGLTEIAVAPDQLLVRARSYAPSDLELDLRRGFESSVIDMGHGAAGSPSQIEARIKPIVPGEYGSAP